MQLPTSALDEPHDPRTVAVDVFHAVSPIDAGRRRRRRAHGRRIARRGTPSGRRRARHRQALLAKSLANAIGGRFGRVQCTPDLLPADVTGTAVYSPATGAWEFPTGPVFANVLLVDEVNRASPRTQAALLEPMEPHQVTIDGRPTRCRAVLSRRHRESLRSCRDVPAPRQPARSFRDGLHHRAARPRRGARDPEWRRGVEPSTTSSRSPPLPSSPPRCRGAACARANSIIDSCSTSPTGPATIPVSRSARRRAASLSLLASRRRTPPSRDVISSRPTT